jgi:hypothetical protein
MRAQTARLAGEFTAALLHYGPGAHASGSPQTVHGGGPAAAKPSGGVRATYDAAMEQFRAASAAERAAATRHRAGEMSDADYLALREARDRVAREVDAAEQALQQAGRDDGSGAPAAPPGQMGFDFEAEPEPEPKAAPVITRKEGHKPGAQMHAAAVANDKDGWYFAIWRRSSKAPSGIEVVARGTGYATLGEARVAQYRTAAEMKTRIEAMNAGDIPPPRSYERAGAPRYRVSYSFRFPNGEASRSDFEVLGDAGLNNEIARVMKWQEDHGRTMTDIYHEQIK